MDFEGLSGPPVAITTVLQEKILRPLSDLSFSFIYSKGPDHTAPKLDEF